MTGRSASAGGAGTGRRDGPAGRAGGTGRRDGPAGRAGGGAGKTRRRWHNESEGAMSADDIDDQAGMGPGAAAVTPAVTLVPIELVCLDMAGTTVRDDGLVELAFEAALSELAVDPSERETMTSYVRETMGTSKIEVFRALLRDEERAQQANAAFEAAYDELLVEGSAKPIDGAEDAISAIRRSGRKVALLTGFSAATRDRLLAALEWQHVADLTLCPAEAGRGRPYPDLVLTALLRLGASDVAAVAAGGDTAADMASGRRAGASIVAGVLTGADGQARLEQAGATHILASVAELPALLGL